MDVIGVSKSFDGVSVLKDVSLHIEDGEVTVISGASGRGKTTLLNLMMGLIKPDSGEILGVPAKKAAVFQEDRLPECFTALACVKMTAPKTVTREEILTHLTELGLGEHVSKPVSLLSGGQRRRVAIARAVVYGGDILFLDEALTGLDAETKRLACEYIKKYSRGKTVIAVSHDPSDAKLLDANVIEI